MNRLQKIVRGISAKSGLGAYDRILMDRTKATDPSTIMDNAYEKVDLVFSCISYTAKAISQVPLYVMELDKKSDKYFPVGESNPWQKLIDQPNYMTSKIMFVTSIMSYLLLDGCVAIIPFPPSPSKAPDSLWCVPWKFCSYKLDANGHILHWIYQPKGETGPEHIFKVNELFQVKFWNPTNPIEGWAPITAGKLPVMEEYKASEYNSRFFDQGATPGGVLTTPQKLNRDTIELVRDQWTQRHEGYAKSHRIAVLHQDLKYQSTGVTQKDMDFVNLRGLSRESIMQIFGMKKVIMGITESLNYAVAKEQRKEWWNGTCLPVMRMVSDALTFGLFRNQTVYEQYKNFKVQFDISSIEAIHEDYASKVKTSEGLHRMGVPFEDINDMLELGFEKRDWHKMSYIPSNMMCVNYMDVGRENPSPTATPPEEEVVTPDPSEDDTETPEQDLSTDSIKRDWETQFDKMVAIVEPIVKPYTKQLVSRIRRLVFDMRTKTLKTILESEGEFKGKFSEPNLFDLEYKRVVEGVVKTWEEMSKRIYCFVNSEKVDNNVEDLDNLGQLDERFNEFKMTLTELIEEKRDDISTILLTKTDKEDAAREIRQLFNLSLTQVWPIVKLEVRRISHLVLLESTRPLRGTS